MIVKDASFEMWYLYLLNSQKIRDKILNRLNDMKKALTQDSVSNNVGRNYINQAREIGLQLVANMEVTCSPWDGEGGKLCNSGVKTVTMEQSQHSKTGCNTTTTSTSRCIIEVDTHTCHSSDTPVITTRTMTVQNQLFGGRFSYIHPMEISVTLGIVNCSHINKDPKFHIKNTCKVQVPLGCFILFHVLTFHYGDKTMMIGGQPMHGCRAFAYMVEDGYIPETKAQTYIAGVDDFCQVPSCEACNKAKDVLANVVDEDNVWKPTPEEIECAKMGELVLGDMELLGWAIIKGYIPPGSKTNKLSMELSHMKYVCPVEWTNITGKYESQSGKLKRKKRKMNSKVTCDLVASDDKEVTIHDGTQFKSLIDDRYGLDYLANNLKRDLCGEKRANRRIMKYEQGMPEGEKTKYPIICKSFQDNLVLASLFVRKHLGLNIKYKFLALNMIMNQNFVREQQVHRDYYSHDVPKDRVIVTIKKGV